MIRVGRIFPRSDRAPFIEPIAEASLRAAISDCAPLSAWQIGNTERISSGFYTSQAMEIKRR
jgi:magnesium-protoporphyrin O-methyltransferase